MLTRLRCPRAVREVSADTLDGRDVAVLREAHRLRWPVLAVIRDTSAQDRPLQKPAVNRSRRRWIWVGVVVLACAAGATMLVRGWLSADRSVDRSRLRTTRAI